MANHSVTIQDSNKENIEDSSEEEGDAIPRRIPDIDRRRAPSAQAPAKAKPRKSAIAKQNNNNNIATARPDPISALLAKNRRMIESVGFNNGPRPPTLYLISTRDLAWDDDLDRRATATLSATLPNIAKGNHNKPWVFPFKYVYRGADMKRVIFNSVSLAEHLWGIFLIIRDNAVDNEVKPYLLVHMEQVLEDSCEDEWATALVQRYI